MTMDGQNMESMELVRSATLSIAQLNNYGLVGTLMAILITFAAIAIWYLARHCEKRTDAALTAYKEESITNREAYKEESKLTREESKLNRDVIQSLQLTMVELKTLIATKVI